MASLELPTKPIPYAAYPPFAVRRFTVEEYLRMIDTGVLDEDDDVELLEGWIVPKMPRNPPHDCVIMKLTRRITPKLPAAWLLFPQCGLEMLASVPEPDIMIARGPEDRYEESRPVPADLAVVMEVADSTLDTDREIKGPAYAHASIPCYWIINIPERQIELYTDPSGPRPDPAYEKRRDFLPGSLIPLLIGRRAILRIPVIELLP